MASQYFTRRSASSTTTAEVKNNGVQNVQRMPNFLKSYASASTAEVPGEGPNAVPTNALNVQPPVISTASVESTMKPAEGQEDEMDQKGEAHAGSRSLGHEHFRKLKEARKRAGLLKVDKKLKKKRLNARLEKVLKPKNAFLIFNELSLKPEYNIQENIRGPGFPKSYTALLTLDGRTYSGEGLNIAGAKMVAADVALKDWFTRFFKKSEPSTVEVSGELNNGEEKTTILEREPAPWSAVGSYAMHLLFTRWQMDVSAMTSPVSVVGDEISSVSSVSDSVPGSVVGFKNSNVPSVPKPAKIVSELMNYSAPPTPKLPPNPEQCQPLYVFNLAFPNVPFVENVNEANADERFRLQCKINDVIYEAKARNKKDARRMIAVQVLKNFGLEFPSPQPGVPCQAALKTEQEE